MVGRNDSCPCGSGKKYKRCCLGKNEETVETLIEDELSRIIRGIYQQSRSRAEMRKYENYQDEWNDKLGQYWEKDNINVAATEYFLFVEQQQAWQSYIETILQGTLRDAVRSVVELWKEPIVLFGKVKNEENGLLAVEEVCGEETYTLEISEQLEDAEEIVAFGIALRDNRQQENGLYRLSSLLFLKDVNESFEKAAVNLIESRKEDSTFAFYQNHMVEIYELMFDRDNTTKEDLIDAKLEDEQQEALTILEDVLNELDIIPQVKESLENVGITYFIKEKPRFRKPNVIAAAVFTVALELEMLGELTMTNREIAERFDVSTSSIKPHAERINGFVEELLEKTKETV